MALVKFEIAVAADSTLPRDRLVNTLHFNIQEIPLIEGSPDFSALCHDLADIYNTQWHTEAHEIKVTAYNQEGSPPHYPEGSWTLNTGFAPASNMPREVAICLSFYADRNIPRHRGRIYLPCCTSGLAISSPRPSPAMIAKAKAMSTYFRDLGGADVDWQVWSVRDATGRNVQNAWVDDEWDTMRSRGLRATTRSIQSIGE